MKALIVGDVHGRFDLLNRAIEHYKPEIIFQCGELGYWPKFIGFDINNIENGDCPIYFCDGNHDDHWSLASLEDKQVKKNIYFMKRGEVLNINGKNILFMGGALSIDKHLRTEGIDWFREETISEYDFQSLPDEKTKIDIAITHTVPTFVVDQMMKKSYYSSIYRMNITFSNKYPDPSTDALSEIFKIYKPKEWYCGHWHVRDSFKIKGCKFEVLAALSMLNSPVFEDAILPIEI